MIALSRDWTQIQANCSKTTNKDEVYNAMHTFNYRNLWKLADISHQNESSYSLDPLFSKDLLTVPQQRIGVNYADDDVGFYVGSTLDSWEWDKDC